MPNISVADQQALADELSTRLNNLDSGTPDASLVYLARMIEIFNGNANLSSVSAEGTAQITAVQTQGATERSQIETTGDTEVTAVQNAGQTERNALNGLQTSIEADLQGYRMSPAKVYFLSQS